MADAVVPAAVPVGPAAGAAAQPQNREEKPALVQLLMKVRRCEQQYLGFRAYTLQQSRPPTSSSPPMLRHHPRRPPTTGRKGGKLFAGWVCGACGHTHSLRKKRVPAVCRCSGHAGSQAKKQGYEPKLSLLAPFARGA